MGKGHTSKELKVEGEKAKRRAVNRETPRRKRVGEEEGKEMR